MFVAKVTGSVVATQKVDSMTGHKLLTVEPLRVDPAKRDNLIGVGRTFVVIDAVGAGEGETVLIVQGTADAVVPIRFGRRLFDLATTRKTFITVDGAGHLAMGQRLNETIAWIAAQCPH